MNDSRAMNNAPAHGGNTSSRQLADVLTDPRGASVAELTFGPDLLGPDFGVHYVEMGDDPDGEPPVRFALVRYFPAEASGSTAASAVSDPTRNFYGRPALLFVHGMTDYFFQDHVARFFHEAGYAVYAIDMRKCGRAWREGQTWHHVTSQAIYDEDLSIALGLIGTAHPTVVAVGHSTGGLDVTTWAGRLNAATQRDPSSAEAGLHGMLGAVVGNSPWYGIQFDGLVGFVIKRVFPQLAKVAPHIPLPEGINPSYGHSLHADYAGEWDYDLELKPIEPRKKYVSWMAGVVRQIADLQAGHCDTGLPTLVLTSDGHYFGRGLTDATYVNDPILKPEQMWQTAPKVSPHAHIEVIADATHDVFLSRPAVRRRALNATADWLAAQGIAGN
ncbi:alpha/beta hydrolase [Corynebacterium sp. HMSC27B11]|uniref:alpha/beta hydrolase n=1 Tax=Corynebacterium sp. HMSC27B11 TaxID=1581065 RepID=UPI0008A2AADE|nr:alpha/beta hydrolase [Corynebacterium sp. HMSC27B11]OFS18144.1 lysophospholipase [Corynebacterium sp. HMSC27B11]